MINEAIILSLFAGLATGIGGLFVVILKRTSDRFVAGSMGFASGVMLIVSFLNLFMESLELTNYLYVTISFTIGSTIMIIIDTFLPHLELGKRENGAINSRLVRSGLLILIGITLHNIPEGVIISAGYSHLPTSLKYFFHRVRNFCFTFISMLFTSFT